MSINNFTQFGQDQQLSNIIMHPLAMIRRGMRMEKADLRGRDYRKFDFFQSNLQLVDARDSDFRGAQLVECDLRGANFSGANLRGADLCRVDGRESSFKAADLRGARLWGANLQGADCTGVDFRNADLRNVRLDKARIEGVKLSPFKIVPEEGAFVGWQTWGGYLFRFLIPEEAKRINSVGSRLCRANRVRIMGCWDRNRQMIKEGTFVRIGDLEICVDRDFQLVGHDYSDDIRTSEGGGIQFFLSYEEAAVS